MWHQFCKKKHTLKINRPLKKTNLSTPCGSSVNLDCFFENFSQIWLGFTMVVCKKIYLEARKSNKCIWLNNDNTTLLNLILRTAELCVNFPSIPKDGSNIYRFLNREWVLTSCSIGNLWISMPSLSKKNSNVAQLSLM